MGGRVTWVIRKEDRSELRMIRWTNIFPFAAINPDFLAGTAKGFEESTGRWFEMKEDWEKNAGSGKFKFEMTDFYAPYPAPLAPTSYGIIVSDFVSKMIISANKYATLGQHYSENVWLERFDEPDQQEDRQKLERAYLEGRLVSIKVLDRPKGAQDFDVHELASRGMTFAQTMDHIRSQAKGFAMAKISLPHGWSGTTYEPNCKGMRLLKEDLVDRGFQFSEADEKEFAEWLEDQEEVEEAI